MYFRFHSFLPPHRDTRWRGQVSWCHQFGVVVSPWCHPSLVTPRCHLTDKLAEIQSSLLSPFTCFSDCPICNPFELFVFSPISFHFTEEFLSTRQTQIYLCVTRLLSFLVFVSSSSCWLSICMRPMTFLLSVFTCFSLFPTEGISFVLGRSDSCALVSTNSFSNRILVQFLSLYTPIH